MTIVTLGIIVGVALIGVGIYEIISKSGKSRVIGKFKIGVGIVVITIAVIVKLVLAGAISGREVVIAQTHSIKYNTIEKNGSNIVFESNDGELTCNRYLSDIKGVIVSSEDEEYIAYEEYRYMFMGIIENESRVYVYMTKDTYENVKEFIELENNKTNSK